MKKVIFCSIISYIVSNIIGFCLSIFSGWYYNILESFFKKIPIYFESHLLDAFWTTTKFVLWLSWLALGIVSFVIVILSVFGVTTYFVLKIIRR